MEQALFGKEELDEAKRQLLSLEKKTKNVLATLREREKDGRRMKAQTTLSERRLKAYRISITLIDKELEAVQESTFPAKIHD